MGRLTDRFFYVVAVVCVGFLTVMLIGASLKLQTEIRENRRLSYEIECILLTPPDLRTEHTIPDCRAQADLKI